MKKSAVSDYISEGQIDWISDWINADICYTLQSLKILVT